eukprot:maker-scaffold871_size86487-snap-gene-0.30 protein:Tk08310 transcript:maker-scaffold871_size86487-snap-gene-0.30-mRNA-1 annotation:"b-cell receptor-associated protein 31"
MSLHWTLIAGFLYAEIAVIILLLIPFISPRSWNKLFKSRFLKGLENQLIYYFYVLVAILILFFLDALREMKKYSDEGAQVEGHHTVTHLDAQMQQHMRLFRAQRNFYISGFALFLCLVIKKMVALLSQNAYLEAEREAAMRQATSASKAAESLMDAGTKKGDSTLEKKLKETEQDLGKAKKDLESMKSQSENLSAEYDRLLEEKDRLERKVQVLGGGGDQESKKDD